MTKQQGDAPSNSLRVMFWNVENFGYNHVRDPDVPLVKNRDENDLSNPLDDKPTHKRVDENKRVKEIVRLIEEEDIDVACIAETVRTGVLHKLAKALPPGYTIQFNFPEGGHALTTIFKNAADRNYMVTQRNDFKWSEDRGRAYTLLTVFDKTSDQEIAILPMHAKCGSNQRSFEMRQDTLERVTNVAESLRKHDVSLIAFGDMNTMGNGGVVDSETEIERTKMLMYDPSVEMDGMAYEDWQAAKMLLLTKDQPYTWHGVDDDNVYPDSNFDHVFVSEDLASSITEVNDNGDQVHVGGWTDHDDKASRDEWVRDYSDHAYVIVDVNLSPKSP